MRYRRRNSLRMPGYVYTSEGIYFVTINARHSRALFGEIRSDVMYPNEIGKCIIEHWYEIPSHYAHVQLDEFQLMPNHLHGIIIFQNRGAHEKVVDNIQHDVPTRYHRSGQMLQAGSLSVIVGTFKASVTRSINRKCASGIKLQIWHRNYYDVIIRSNLHLMRVRRYIRHNVKNYKRARKKSARAGRGGAKSQAAPYMAPVRVRGGGEREGAIYVAGAKDRAHAGGA